MDRIIDLDAAAMEIESRRARWTEAGLSVGPVTWRDTAGDWPYPLATDRAAVIDPDSVGVALNQDAWPSGEIVLFRDGRADVDLFDPYLGDVVSENPDVPTVAVFGDLLDHLANRLLGLPRQSDDRAMETESGGLSPAP